MNFSSDTARAEWSRLYPSATPQEAVALCASEQVTAHLGAVDGTVVLEGSSGGERVSLLCLAGPALFYGSFTPPEGSLASCLAGHLRAACSLGIVHGHGDFPEDYSLVGFEGGKIRYAEHCSPPEGAPDALVFAALARKRVDRALDLFARARVVGTAWTTASPAAEVIASGADAEASDCPSRGPISQGEPLGAQAILHASACFCADRIRLPSPSFARAVMADFAARGGPAGASWLCRAAARFRAVSPWPPSPDGEVWHPPGEKRQDRDDMPQIPADRFDDFLDFARKEGVSSSRLGVACGLLSSGQKSIDPLKAWKMSRSKHLSESLERILISSEGILLDGHHRWAALVLRGDPSAVVDCVKLHATFERCLTLAKRFLEEDGADFSRETTTDGVVSALVEAARELRGEIFLDGYGSLFWHPKKREAYYVTADSTEPEEARRALSALEAIAGEGKVRIESETPPRKGEGWKKIFPPPLETVGFLDAATGTAVHFSLGMTPPGTYDSGGYDYRAPSGVADADLDETSRTIRMLRKRFKKGFGEEQRAAARDLVLALDEDSAMDVYRGLMKGGPDPLDQEEAAWKLYRALGRLPRFEGPDSPASFRKLLGDYRPGILRVRALAGRSREGTEARRSFQSSWKALASALGVVLSFQGRQDGTTSPEMRPDLAHAETCLRDARTAALDARELVLGQGKKARDEVARMLAPVAKAEWDVTGDATVLPAFSVALRWVQSLVARRGGENGKIVVKADVERDLRRSVFEKPSTIRLCPSDGVRACCHLLGHVLECQLPGSGALAMALARFRTQGEVASDLGMVEGGMALAGEEGRLGTFDQYFRGTDAWYCGKLNPKGGSEILAMGMEAIYEDAFAFAAADPEYLLTVIGVLTGDLRGKWPPAEGA